jgi:TolB-like protein
VAEVRTTEKSANISLVAPVRSVAVLPFRPLVAETRDAALELGMAETLITRLSSRAIVVRPISSVRKYMDLDQDPLAAGRELSVELVLDGSIQRCGDQIRVTARLVNVTNGAAIWSGTFDEKFTSIFAVQDAIAKKVAGSLALELTTGEKVRLTKRYTENTEAYQAYLNGLYYWYKHPAPGYEKSRDYFQQSIDCDPNYALGHLGLSLYYGFASAVGILPPNENWPRSEEAANKALTLDDTLAEIYNPQAAVKLYYYHDWSAAERYFRRGIELNPNSAEIRHHYAMCLVLFGRNDEAITEIQRASELDPLALRNNLDRAKIFFFIHQYDRAIDQFRKTLELEPNFAAAHELLGYAYEKGGCARKLSPNGARR